MHVQKRRIRISDQYEISSKAEEMFGYIGLRM